MSKGDQLYCRSCAAMYPIECPHCGQPKEPFIDEAMDHMTELVKQRDSYQLRLIDALAHGRALIENCKEPCLAYPSRDMVFHCNCGLWERKMAAREFFKESA